MKGPQALKEPGSNEFPPKDRDRTYWQIEGISLAELIWPCLPSSALANHGDCWLSIAGRGRGKNYLDDPNPFVGCHSRVTLPTGREGCPKRHVERVPSAQSGAVNIGVRYGVRIGRLSSSLCHTRLAYCGQIKRPPQKRWMGIQVQKRPLFTISTLYQLTSSSANLSAAASKSFHSHFWGSRRQCRVHPSASYDLPLWNSAIDGCCRR